LKRYFVFFGRKTQIVIKDRHPSRQVKSSLHFVDLVFWQ
jgi:hypothetical protein